MRGEPQAAIAHGKLKSGIQPTSSTIVRRNLNYNLEKQVKRFAATLKCREAGILLQPRDESKWDMLRYPKRLG
jgi:hypothetical protein